MSDAPTRPNPIAYLDQVAASTPGRAYKHEVLDLLDLRPGQTIVDLGCGPGTDLAAMAAAVALKTSEPVLTGAACIHPYSS